MIQIVLTEEQFRAVQVPAGPVEVRDPQGNLIGYVSRGVSAADILEAQRRLASAGPWFTTEQVLRRLDSLEPE